MLVREGEKHTIYDRIQLWTSYFCGPKMSSRKLEMYSMHM